MMRGKTDKPIILFQGGTHGHFLQRILSVASGYTSDFDFYKGKIGAHSKIGDDYLVEVSHPYLDYCYEPIPVWCFITISKENLYEILWYLTLAGGEYGINLLEHSQDEYEHMSKAKPDHKITELYSMVKNFQTDTDGYREMFKVAFYDVNGLVKLSKKTRKEYPAQNIIPVSMFYDQETFIKTVKHLLKTLGKEYKVDVTHHWDAFIAQKRQIIKSKQRVHSAFQHWVDKKSYDTSDFVIYEQAYLDFLIEEHIGKTIEICYPNGYPCNVLEHEARIDYV